MFASVRRIAVRFAPLREPRRALADLREWGTKNPGFFDFRGDEKFEIFAVLGWDEKSGFCDFLEFSSFRGDEKIEILRFSWIFVFCLGMKKSRFCEIFAALWWMKKSRFRDFPRFWTVF